MSNKNQTLTMQESTILKQVIPMFQSKFADEDKAKVSIFSFNDDYVDFEIIYANGETEQQAVLRELLSSETAEKIVRAIQ